MLHDGGGESLPEMPDSLRLRRANEGGFRIQPTEAMQKVDAVRGHTGKWVSLLGEETLYCFVTLAGVFGPLALFL